MKHLLKLLAFLAGMTCLGASCEQVVPRLTPYQKLVEAYPDGRMTLGFRLLNNVKRHLERVDLLAGRYRMSQEDIEAVRLAKTYITSIDLLDLRTSVVVAQIDLRRSEIYVKNAKDVLAGMDKAGGLSTRTVQVTAQIVDAVLRQTGVLDQSISTAVSLSEKYEVIRKGTLDPLVLSSSLEVAASGFLEVVSQDPANLEELRRSDATHYVEISRWLASARSASAELQKQSLYGSLNLPSSLAVQDFQYQPTPWVVGTLKVSYVNNATALATVVRDLNENPWRIEGIDKKSAGDLAAVIGSPQLVSYDEAVTLRAKYFKGSKLRDELRNARYIDIAGVPLIVSAKSAPVIGGEWQSVKHPTSESKSKFFSVADFATSQQVSGDVALDTLFVLLGGK